MSGFNLIANLVTPHYPTMYLVRSKVMEEAERRKGSRFNYAVGELVEESGTDEDGWPEIAGYFKHDDKVLHVTPSGRKKKRIKIYDSSSGESSQKNYVPACPRFRRTDDTRYAQYSDRMHTRCVSLLLSLRLKLASYSHYRISVDNKVLLRRGPGSLHGYSVAMYLTSWVI